MGKHTCWQPDRTGHLGPTSPPVKTLCGAQDRFAPSQCTHLRRALMASSSCSFSAWVVPRYCQAWRGQTDSLTRQSPSTLSPTSFPTHHLTRSLGPPCPPPRDLRPPPSVPSGGSLICSQHKPPTSMCLGSCCTAASKSSTALGRSPSWSRRSPSSKGWG